MSPPPHLIAGLGNPGSEYARTRHNAGFLVVEALHRAWGIESRETGRFEALLGRGTRGGRVVWLARPLTFMNASGESVGALVRYYRVPLTQVLVVVDDADLPLGTVRLRPEGSSGGHHGLESVETHLGTRGYARLRLGIGRREDAPGVRQITGHVLGRFGEAEGEVFDRVVVHAVAQLTCWLEDGIQKAMARFNGALAETDRD